MARTVAVKLLAEVSGYVAGVKTAAKTTKDFTGTLSEAAKKGKLDAVADQARNMGLALGVAFGGIVLTTARFDKAMSEVGAVSNATGKDLDRLRQAALDAGRDTAFSASQAAEAEAELAKAGLSTGDILSGALKGSLDLAAAGQLDLAKAADIAAKAMGTFHLEGKDVGHIADVLAAGANKSAVDVAELGEALKMGGLAANAAGLSLEETVGTLAAFGDRALNGSDAGTSLKTMLLRLQAPAGEAAELMKKLGINAYDANGNFVGTIQLAGQLQRSLGGLTQEQRNSALATIFGADAMRAANVLYELGGDGVRDYVAAVNDQGAATDVAAKKMDNLAGDVEKLKGTLETLAIQSGSGATGGLRTLVQMVDGLVKSLSAIPAPVQTAMVIIAGAGGAALLAASAAVKLKSGMGRALEELGNAGPIGQRAASGLSKVAGAVGKVSVALAAVQVASAALGSSVNPQVESLAKHLAEFGKTGRASGEATRVFGDDLKKLDTALKDVADSGAWSSFARGTAGTIEGFTGLGNVMDDSLQKSKERLQALDQALTQLVQAGQLDDAKAAFDRIAESAAKQGVSVRELQNVLPGYTAAVEMAGTKATDAATGTQKAVGATNDMADAAEEAKKKAEELADAYDRIFGATMGADRASIAYKDGLKELQKELETGKHTLDTNTQAGRDNVSAVLDQVDKINDLRQANIDNGMAVEEANGKYSNQIESLRATLKQLGYNKAEVDALINRYKAIPGSVYTKATADTKQAVSNVTTLQRKITDLKGKTITITLKYREDTRGIHVSGGIGSGTQVRRWGGITEHAQQGLLRDAAVFTPRAPARYAFAEPATGGEAFVPRFGNRQQSMSILDRAAGWYGAQVMPAAMTIRPVVHVHVTPVAAGGDRLMSEVVKGVRYVVRVDGGGDVQRALGA